jgi:ribosomal protein RSM22 (predicted rRNA methylase)
MTLFFLMTIIGPCEHDKPCREQQRCIACEYDKNVKKSQSARENMCQLWKAVSMAQKMGA